MLVKALFIAAALFVGYLLVKAYMPLWFKPKIEPFVQKVSSPPVPSKVNTPPAPIPAPAPPVAAEPPQEPRTVSPGGPNPPNAAGAEAAPPTVSPDARPVDPYDDMNMSAPIKDTMRNPERSFGPGVDNTGVKRAASSGVANSKALTSESPFSPDFAQNGGMFMGSVTANDMTHDDTYATA